MPRDSWIRVEGRTYPVPASRLVVTKDGQGLWLELYTGGEDDEIFQSSGGVTINGLFVPGARELSDLANRTLEIAPGSEHQVELDDESFFWELGETLEIESLRLRLGQRQGNLCTIEVEAQLLRHEVNNWRQIRAAGRIETVVEG